MDTTNTKLNASSHPNLRSRQASGCRETERGVALIITLLLLSLVTVLSLGMVIAFSSQTLIGGYYRNYRGAFYAADSGLNIGRQRAMTELVASMPTTYPSTPAVGSCGASTSSTIATDYASSTSLNTGTAAPSWKESFKIPTATITGPAFQLGVNQYTCTYTYNITSAGTASGSEQQSVSESGSIIVTVTGASATNTVSFSYFGAFIDKYAAGTGPLVPGTMTGPMFTNDSWEFMASIPPWTAPYIFTDPVSQHNPTVDYWDASWNQHWSSATSYGSGANRVAPTFEQGLNLNQPLVPLPANAFSQEWAALDGVGSGEATSTPTAADMNSKLKGITGAAYPVAGASSGVFMNFTCTGACNGSNGTVAGGGLFVQGNADVQLIPSGSAAQIYKITQGSTVTTVTIDPSANSGLGRTTIVSGSTTQTLSGIPMNSATTPPQAATMVYVNGNMTIHGPGEGQGAVQDNAMITMTANGDITATGDVLYKTEPVTIPADTLVPPTTTNPMNQVLGLYTATGNFIVHNSQADQNIQVDGSIATISQADSANCSAGKGGQLTSGHVNTFNNVGGMIQSCIFAADMNTENTWFDRRFTSRPGFAPPWFPSTVITTGGALPATATAAPPRRIQWVSTSSQ